MYINDASIESGYYVKEPERIDRDFVDLLGFVKQTVGVQDIYALNRKQNGSEITVKVYFNANTEIVTQVTVDVRNGKTEREVAIKSNSGFILIKELNDAISLLGADKLWIPDTATPDALVADEFGWF